MPEKFRFQVCNIEERYRNEAEEMGSSSAPRNLPFYNMIRENYGDFHLVDTGDQVQVETYWKGKKHSLLAYLLNIIPANEIAPTAELSKHSNGLINANSVGKFIDDLKKLGACGFAKGDVGRLTSWLETVASGEPFTVVSPVCPDYSAEQTDSCRHRFTFETLGSGCGLSGTRIIGSIEEIHRLIDQFSANRGVDHHFLVGDFEALDQETTARLGITVDEFLIRNERSCKTLAEASPTHISAELFTHYCGGLDGWAKRHQDTVEYLKKRLLGDEKQSNPEIVSIAKARLPLYRRWFASPEMCLDEALPIVIRQGAEYALMAQVIKENFDSPLILGADHHKMAYFYKLIDGVPVIYLDRNYE